MSNQQIVLDASALLALLHEEPGHKEVEKVLTRAVMSSVNLTEVMSVFTEFGISQKEGELTVLNLVQEIISFDQQQALIAAALQKQTRTKGLSLGDRACLALTKSLKTTVLTADKIWAKLSIDDIDIKLIR